MTSSATHRGTGQNLPVLDDFRRSLKLTLHVSPNVSHDFRRNLKILDLPSMVAAGCVWESIRQSWASGCWWQAPVLVGQRSCILVSGVSVFHVCCKEHNRELFQTNKKKEREPTKLFCVLRTFLNECTLISLLEATDQLDMITISGAVPATCGRCHKFIIELLLRTLLAFSKFFTYFSFKLLLIFFLWDDDV